MGTYVIDTYLDQKKNSEAKVTFSGLDIVGSKLIKAPKDFRSLCLLSKTFSHDDAHMYQSYAALSWQ